jgi:DNA polymerase III subunit delta
MPSDPSHAPQLAPILTVMAKAEAKKSGTAAALDYLSQPEKNPPAGVIAAHGDDAYLKSEVLSEIQRQVLRGGDAEFAVSSFTGREALLRDVLDALATVSLFGDGARLVIVDDADSFVSEYRTELEDYLTHPAKDSVLVLSVKTWPANTRLAKAVAAQGLAIDCAPPKERQVKTWLAQRAKSLHQMRLEAAAADILLELVPPELGILAQEIDKLSLVAGENGVIDAKLVRENVGGWRARATWDMIDAAADGRAAEALAQLDRIISSGEKPQGVLPQMASTLRKFATAIAFVEAEGEGRGRLSMRDALAQAGIPPFKLGDAERQLRQIGRRRGKQLTGWLLAADLAMKGHNSADDRARIELERLIVRLQAGSHPEGTWHGAGSKTAARS